MSQGLRRTVVMRDDCPVLDVAQSIERRLLDDGLKLEDIINIESKLPMAWIPGDFVIVWTRTKTDC